MNATLAKLCAVYGVVWRYLDGAGQIKEAPEESCIAILNAMGLDIRSPADIEHQFSEYTSREEKRELPDTLIVEVNKEYQVSGQFGSISNWRINLEDGSVLNGSGASSSITLPPLPLGIHTLQYRDLICTVLSAPAALQPPKRGWGVMAPLYGLRTETNKVIGDYHDLGELAAALGPAGVDFVGVNPVHTGFLFDPTAYSPYSPSSRQRLNPLHIAVDRLPEWPDISSRFPPLGELGELVDYPSVTTLKMEQLKAAFVVFQQNGGSKDFENFVYNESKNLHDFATHQALSEVHGPYWPQWPIELQSPDHPETVLFAAENDALIRFHSWLQWLATIQLKDAQHKAVSSGMAYGLYLDLAVGTHPFGAETWANESVFSRQVFIGSPSDSFNASGQNWGLVPFNPLEIKARQYAPLIETLRAQLRYAGILRIDHILGFERSFWIPDGLPGAYVTFPRDSLLAVARIEAARASAYIVGEDLGNVPEGLRNELDKSGIMGCRVAFFERDWKSDKSFTPAADYTELALASITTHDLPTLTGWWNGVDIDWREQLLEISAQQALIQKSERRKDCEEFAKAIGFSYGLSNEDANQTQIDQSLAYAAYQFLAQSNSVLVAVQIEDLLELTEQPNLPGTTTEHPNWRRCLPKTVREIAQLPLLSQVSICMQAANRGVPNRK